MEHLFQYAVLRYIHDPARDEFLNIGIVVYSKGSQYVGGRFITDCTRLSCVFSSFNPEHLLRTLASLSERVDELNKTYWDNEYQFQRAKDFVHSRLLPANDNSLQFGGFGGGITDNLDDELDRLYERMVSRDAGGKYNEVAIHP